MLCFDKLIGEDNNRKTLLKLFVLWEYIFKEAHAHFEITDKRKAPTYQGITKGSLLQLHRPTFLCQVVESLGTACVFQCIYLKFNHKLQL